MIGDQRYFLLNDIFYLNIFNIHIFFYATVRHAIYLVVNYEWSVVYSNSCTVYVVCRHKCLT